MALFVHSIAPGVHQWDLRLKDLGPFLYVSRLYPRAYNLAILHMRKM